MTHLEFTHHALDIRSAVIAAIEVYMVGQGLAFNRAAFIAEKETDLTQLGKEALFYGADVVPDEVVLAS
ncbi:hypothetical protein B9J07_27905 [Sinorhizobium sp. LM21]|uniref:hypothetical protein n=1 Tax=Sinorhizobium sp. LM21 TaxID=1449788 RepID=UPI0005D7891B|nr:hypothetical protein [Sinorhizobium sp. LM21]AJW30182.1 hypothetical protein pLM21S1_p62 [Sinorhizobium sp. LM21]OWZ90414.1 hypothetical protein B9J07_27905 [Sinorhizobium sp. LM21]